MKIYISGKVSDNPTYKEDFERIEGLLNQEFPDDDTINPVKVLDSVKDVLTWEECMQVCFKLLDAADAIFLMENWKQSRGAHLELEYAKSRRMYVIGKIRDVE